MVASLLMLSGVAVLRRDGLTGVGVLSRLKQDGSGHWIISFLLAFYTRGSVYKSVSFSNTHSSFVSVVFDSVV